jgi:nucleotide-binding universal stress UspA family protein
MPREEAIMEAVKTILAAIDLSEYSPQVLRFASGLARDLRCELVVVNVINQRDVDAVEKVEREVPSLSVEKYIQTIFSERLNLIDKMLAQETADSTLTRKRLVKVGIPFREILKAIEEEKADILVMGTRGRGHIAGVLFGSTAEKLFRRCAVPLVSVRPEDHAEGS